ncbi:MAG: P-loop NTPase [Clostridia bacterium]|nr:P-loop NTPase [Clostridia bacterium]
MADETQSKNARIILFTSCKGGVGKSTVCANLAMSVALSGKDVLVIDCDFGSRCLDIVAGFSDRAVYDISDAVVGRVPPEKVVVKDNRCEHLSFIAAPYSVDAQMNLFLFKRTIAAYATSGRYDYIFIDTPGGAGDPLLYASAVADTAYIITSSTKVSVRAADKTASFLYDKGVKRLRLIINKVTGTSAKKAKDELISVIDGAAVKLIGAVPYDPELIRAGDEGKLTDELYSTNLTRAFDNIARRTEGEQVPLFYKIRRLKRLK